MPYSSKVNRITKELIRFRNRKIIIDLETIAWIGLAIAIVTILLFLTLESIFWFSTTVRYNCWIVGLCTGIGAILIIAITTILIHLNRVERYLFSTVARDVGAVIFKKRDEVLNAFQLEENLATEQRTSKSLADNFITIIHQQLSRLNPKSVLNREKVRRIRLLSLFIFGVSLILIGIFPSQLKEAGQHWIHPHVNFPVPLPFQLFSRTGDLSIMGGDDATIEIYCSENAPEIVTLEIIGEDNKLLLVSGKLVNGILVSGRTALTKDENGLYIHEINDIFQNLYYRAYVKSSYFWQPWDEVSSPTYTISVIDRPTIEDFTVTVTPPPYTGLNPTIQKGNIAEIRGLKGSTISIEVRADKFIDYAYLKFEFENDVKPSTPDTLRYPIQSPISSPIPSGQAGQARAPHPSTLRYRVNRAGRAGQLDMSVHRKRASMEFPLMEDGIMETHIFDQRNISNLDPIQYHLIVLTDLNPDLQVIQPKSPMELGSDFTIPVQLHIEDDFGFSNLQIVYETHHPEYLETREIVSVQNIEPFSKIETSQDVYYAWNVNDLNLMPEDELKFHFELYDNDIISGPKKAISQTLIARFPSLADLFTRTNEEENELEEIAEDILEDLSEIDETLESLELDLLKKEDLNWEQEQTLKQSIEEVREKIKQIEEMQEQIQQIMDQSEKHKLFSQEMIEKFQSLRELLEDIITPELLESMQKLQDVLQEVSPEQLMNALQNLRSNTAELEAQLDRFIEIFERIRAEQKLEEAINRLEQLVEKQAELVTQLQKEPQGDELQRKAEDQARISQEFENIRDVMKDAAESMEPFAKMPSEDLNILAESELSELIDEQLKNAFNQLQNQNLSGGLEMSNMGYQNLQQMLQQLLSIQQQFQQQTVEEMVEKFEAILKNILFISKEQEKLQQDTKNLPRNSPRLREMASRQQLLRDQLAQLIKAAMELSRQTFAVTPEMGKAIGRAAAGMNESLTKLEERNGITSARKQKETVGALNEAALATLAAMESMKSSGSASGFEQFLKRMEQMAGQQQGINNQTLQLSLGQMAASAQQSLMKRLAKEQGQLKKSLEQLMQEMRGSRQAGENLGGIAEDMEEVIKDFKRQRVNKKTIHRQQRILSRMLDSQRSLKQRDLSRKRKSVGAEDVLREGPAGLPTDLGQRRNLAMEALNLALKSGYSKDYQDMIRRYFNALMASEW